MEKVIINYNVKDNDSFIECKTVGSFTECKDYILLEFEEKDNFVKAVYKIYNDRLVVERIGDAVMEMSFKDKAVTQGSLKTDFGYHSDFKVRTLSYTFSNNQIHLKYRLDIEDNNIHVLNLEYSFKKN